MDGIKLKSISQFLAPLALVFAFEARSLTVTGVSGVSNYETDSTTGAVTTIYGGLVQSGCTGDGTGTCNSCDGAGLKACNPESIYTSLKAVFGLKSNTSYGSTIKVIFAKSDNSSFYTDSTPSISGTTLSTSITWGDLCSGLGASACASSLADQTLKIGVDKNANGSLDSDEETISVKVTINYLSTGTVDTQAASCPNGESQEGVCYFTTYPGDGKVFVDTINIGENYTATGLKHINAVFFEQASSATDGSADLATLNSITNGSTMTLLEMSINSSDITLSDDKVPDLENNTRYCFIYATQNMAKNIFYFTPTSTDTEIKNNSKYCGTPSEVVGLLDDKKCFIATVAFGSSLDPHVQTFRNFRDRFLKGTFLGDKFIKYYYQNGPSWASELKKNKSFLLITRAVLWPMAKVIEFLCFCLDFPILFGLFIVAIAVAIFVRFRMSYLFHESNGVQG